MPSGVKSLRRAGRLLDHGREKDADLWARKKSAWMCLGAVGIEPGSEERFAVKSSVKVSHFIPMKRGVLLL